MAASIAHHIRCVPTFHVVQCGLLCICFSHRLFVLLHATSSCSLQIHLSAEGTSAIRVPAANVIEVLRQLGNYQTLVLALQVRFAG